MKLAHSSCTLCGRNNIKRKHRPPPMQLAHVVANRFTACEKRYKGARNPFTCDEWREFIERFGSEFNISKNSEQAEIIREISKTVFPMCAECHEEVLSEPFYLPTFLRMLSQHFKGKTRIQKMILLAEILQLGIEEYDRRRRDA